MCTLWLCLLNTASELHSCVEHTVQSCASNIDMSYLAFKIKCQKFVHCCIMCNDRLSTSIGNNFALRVWPCPFVVTGFDFSWELCYEEHSCSGKWKSCNWMWWHEPAFSFSIGLFWSEEQSTPETEKETIWVLYCTNNKVLGALSKWLILYWTLPA